MSHEIFNPSLEQNGAINLNPETNMSSTRYDNSLGETKHHTEYKSPTERNWTEESDGLPCSNDIDSHEVDYDKSLGDLPKGDFVYPDGNTKSHWWENVPIYDEPVGTQDSAKSIEQVTKQVAWYDKAISNENVNDCSTETQSKAESSIIKVSTELGGPITESQEIIDNGDGTKMIKASNEFEDENNNKSSRATIDSDGTIHAEAGSLKEDSKSHQNMYLNYPIESSKYIVDGQVEYKTDNHGRTTEVKIEDVNALYEEKGGQRDNRDSNTQRRVIETKDGRKTDDSGHLFPNSLGGANEAINQVPMNSKLNRSGGEWFSMESQIRSALENGSKVTDYNVKLRYEGSSSRPGEIEVSYRIDGVEYTKTFENK